MQPFRQALHDPGDTDLVDHFRKLSGAARPDMRRCLRIAANDRCGSVEYERIAAHHYRQLAAFRAGLAARHRRIEKADGLLCRDGMNLARNLRRCRRMVDNNCTRRNAVEYP